MGTGAVMQIYGCQTNMYLIMFTLMLQPFQLSFNFPDEMMRGWADLSIHSQELMAALCGPSTSFQNMKPDVMGAIPGMEVGDGIN